MSRFILRRRYIIMNWFSKLVPPKIKSLIKTDVPDNLWIKCPSCEQMIFHKDIETKQRLSYGKDPSAVHENENHSLGKNQGIRGFRFARLFDHHSAFLYDLPLTQRHIYLLCFLHLYDDFRHGSLYARRGYVHDAHG